MIGCRWWMRQVVQLCDAESFLGLLYDERALVLILRKGRVECLVGLAVQPNVDGVFRRTAWLHAWLNHTEDQGMPGLEKHGM